MLLHLKHSSFLGPLDGRRAFLSHRIDAEQPVLDNLRALGAQDALLILRVSLQHNLAHLLRTLGDGLDDLWARRDAQLHAALAHIRGPRPAGFDEHLVPLDDATDAAITSLPTRLGGLGLLSHKERAPLAYAAATEAARATLTRRLHDDDAAPPVASQHLPLLLQRRNALWDRLCADQRVALVESTSPLGRRWLTVVPTQRALVLSDDAVSAALWTRALPLPPDDERCMNCTESPPFASGHFDTCDSRKAARTFAHERAKFAVGRALGNVAGAEVETEPTIRGRQSRNDVRLRLIAGADCPLPSVDIDVSIMAVSCKTAPASRRDCTSAEAVTASIQLTLNGRANSKRERQPDPMAFVPFVLSAGGVLLDDTDKAVAEWRRHISATPHPSLGDELHARQDRLRASQQTSCALLHQY